MTYVHFSEHDYIAYAKDFQQSYANCIYFIWTYGEKKNKISVIWVC